MKKEIRSMNGQVVYSVADNGDVIVRVSAKSQIVDNLKKAAAAMNSVGWCGSCNTPLSILSEFVLRQDMLDWGGKYKNVLGNGLYGYLDCLCDGIETGAEEGDENDRRLSSLRFAFRGVLGSGDGFEGYDEKDRETLKRIAEKNGVSTDSVVSYFRDLANGRRRRGRRLDLSL